MDTPKGERTFQIVAMLRRFASGSELPTDDMPSFSSLADRIEAAHRLEIRHLQNKMQEIVRKMQIKTGDTAECEECKKVIAFDEYAINFGLCDECLNKHLKQDGLV